MFSSSLWHRWEKDRIRGPRKDEKKITSKLRHSSNLLLQRLAEMRKTESTMRFNKHC